jgi:hypothetical protein
MKTGSALEQMVNGYWAERFSCTPEDFARPGRLVVEDEEFARSGDCYILWLQT